MTKFKIKFETPGEKNLVLPYMESHLDIKKEKKKSIIVKEKNKRKVEDKLGSAMEDFYFDNQEYGVKFPEIEEK